MSGMLLAISAFDGLYVLKKAQIIDAVRIKTNSFFGNVSGVGIPISIALSRVMPQPTMVPIKTPEKELETTKMKAS